MGTKLKSKKQTNTQKGGTLDGKIPLAVIVMILLSLTVAIVLNR